MNDPSIDNPRLLTAEGEEAHIAVEERHAVQTEQNNAAVAAGAAMARAVLAAEYFRQAGAMPAWATDRED